MASLHEVLGYPVAARLLPTKRSPVWSGFKAALEQWMGVPDALLGRGPSWLWVKLQGTAAPKRCTWGGLLNGWLDATPADLVAALRRHTTATNTTITSWSARWLVDPIAQAVRCKKDIIEDRLARGHIVCVQETHWLGYEAALWRLAMLVHVMYWSDATPDPTLDLDDNHSYDHPRHGRRGRFGGVATFVPPNYRMVNDLCRILVPGHAILVTVDDDAHNRKFIINTYLRPGSPAATWQMVLDAIPPDILHDARTIFVGDFNLDLHDTSAPSIDGNGGDANILVSTGLVVVAPSGPTCKTGTRNRTLDGALSPLTTAANWSVTMQWSHLSDHGILTVKMSDTVGWARNYTCSPAAFWALPDTSRVELRRKLDCVAKALQVPPIQGPTPVVDTTNPP